MSISSFSGPHRWLSNFWPAEVVLDGVAYPTVEHAYQAAKTLCPTEREFVRAATTPGAAKRCGKRITLRPDWDKVKSAVMLNLVRQKFDLDPLGAWLLATADHELIEGNTWGDTFWGMCHGRGQNVLGKILMRVRNELKGAGA